MTRNLGRGPKKNDAPLSIGRLLLGQAQNWRINVSASGDG